jgi:hypothetical protein
MAQTDVTIHPNIVIDCKPTPRLRKRRLDEHDIAAQAVGVARELNEAVVTTFCGGEVGDHYGYSAKTEGALVVAWPDGTVVVRVVKLPANKVRPAGIAAAASPPGVDARAIFDGRYSSRRRDEERMRLEAAAARRVKTGGWKPVEATREAILVKVAAQGGLFKPEVQRTFESCSSSLEAARPPIGLKFDQALEEVL